MYKPPHRYSIFDVIKEHLSLFMKILSFFMEVLDAKNTLVLQNILLKDRNGNLLKSNVRMLISRKK